jgi:hypothetical protein
MKQGFLFVHIILVISTASYAQRQKIVWKNEFLSRNNYITSIAGSLQVPDGIVCVFAKTGFHGEFVPKHKPLINSDTVNRYWVLKFSHDGNIKWKYLIDVCHGYDGGAVFKMEFKNNQLFIQGNLLAPNPGKCGNYNAFMLLCMDGDGNEVFLKLFRKKPDQILIRNKDLLVFNKSLPDYSGTSIHRFGHTGKDLVDSVVLPFSTNYYHAGVNSKDEVFIFRDGHVTKLTNTLKTEGAMDFKPDYSQCELGFPNDRARLKIIDNDKLIVYYSTYRSYVDKDSLGRYLSQCYLMFIDYKAKLFWFKEAGDLAEDDILNDVTLAHDRMYLSWFAYVHPARINAEVKSRLQCYTLDGKVQWEKNYSQPRFFGALKTIADNEYLECYYLKGEKITYDKLTPDGKSITTGEVDINNTAYKSLVNILKVSDKTYIILTNHPYRAGITSVKFE